MRTNIQTLAMHTTVALLLYSLGYRTGRIVDTQVAKDISHITVEDRAPELVPTVTVEGIRNKMLYGSVHGTVRFFVGDVQVIDSGAFLVPAGPLLVHQVEIQIPEGMQFVASKRGTKYYSVNSKNAQSISPENRMYFATSQEALLAGYIK